MAPHAPTNESKEDKRNWRRRKGKELKTTRRTLSSPAEVEGEENRDKMREEQKLGEKVQGKSIRADSARETRQHRWQVILKSIDERLTVEKEVASTVPTFAIAIGFFAAFS